MHWIARSKVKKRTVPHKFTETSSFRSDIHVQKSKSECDKKFLISFPSPFPILLPFSLYFSLSLCSTSLSFSPTSLTPPPDFLSNTTWANLPLEDWVVHGTIHKWGCVIHTSDTATWHKPSVATTPTQISMVSMATPQGWRQYHKKKHSSQQILKQFLEKRKLELHHWQGLLWTACGRKFPSIKNITVNWSRNETKTLQ